MVEVPLLKRDDTVTKARQILRDDSFREIYIHDGKKKLLGYIDISDVLQIRSTKSNVTVEGFMKEPAAVLENTPIEHAVRSIREFRTDSAAVTDEKRVIIGGVIISDLFPIIITRHELRGLAGDYMSRKVISCAPEDPVQKVYNLIIESGFSAFPVIKKNKCLGIISRRDLLKAGRVRSGTRKQCINTDRDYYDEIRHFSLSGRTGPVSGCTHGQVRYQSCSGPGI